MHEFILIQEADLDEDGAIAFEEFKALEKVDVEGKMNIQFLD